MGLFDFMKKNDAKTNSEKKPAESKEKYENPANLFLQENLQRVQT